MQILLQSATAYLLHAHHKKVQHKNWNKKRHKGACTSQNGWICLSSRGSSFPKGPTHTLGTTCRHATPKRWRCVLASLKPSWSFFQVARRQLIFFDGVGFYNLRARRLHHCIERYTCASTTFVFTVRIRRIDDKASEVTRLRCWATSWDE